MNTWERNDGCGFGASLNKVKVVLVMISQTYQFAHLVLALSITNLTVGIITDWLVR
ncbi:hypothetical protein [Hydrocoleum sp. CS-953]|uniref:hypothetical protein n=1 Tax=Microcoleaceae TaxID=1892252 RepID=UPI00143D833E|nr:hypothetical protein [Hydrocoleum sp. CS-953]